MLIEERRRHWLETGRPDTVHSVMTFVGDRLELGARTVLARLVGDPKRGRVLDLEGRETRILALLAAAYRRPISPSVLDHLRRGAKEWARGEACLAQIHLALTGLPRGLAVWLNGVSFDGCRESDGTLLEAKGLNYAPFIDKNGNFYPWYQGQWKITQQLWNQSYAARGRRVEWHVAEQRAAIAIRRIADSLDLNNIVVIYDP